MEMKRNIVELSEAAYPDERMSQLGLEHSEIANLRAGFVRGWVKSEAHNEDLTNCFRSFIRSQVLYFR